MIQTYTIIAIVGFSLAALLVVVALIMFFALHIKQVRDDLTGKTATRSIAEIRSRAKTRKRTTSQAAKRYGWEKEEISTDSLEEVLGKGSGSRRAASTGETLEPEEEAATTALGDQGEEATTILDDDTGNLPDDDDVKTTTLKKTSSKKTRKTAASKTLSVILAGSLILGLAGQGPLAWGKDISSDTDPLTTENLEEDEAALEEVGPTENQPEPVQPNNEGSGDLILLSENMQEKEIRARKRSSLIEVKATQIKVPYGVDIEDWLCTQEIYSESAATVRSLFGDGTPLKLQSQVLGTYPSPEQILKVKWNTDSYLGDADTLASVENVQVTVGKLYTWFSGEVAIQESGSLFTDYTFSGIKEGRQLWLNRLLSSGKITTSWGSNLTQQSTPGKLPALESSGEIKAADAKAEINLPTDAADFPFEDVYVKIRNDIALNSEESRIVDPDSVDEIVFKAGQIIKLPGIRVDTLPPSIKNAQWGQISSGDVLESNLFAQKATLTLTVEDQGLNASLTSGVASVSLTCVNGSTGGSFVPGVATAEPNRYSFIFDQDGEFAFNGIQITVTDHAGNTATQTLAEYFLDPPEGSVAAPDYSTVIIQSTPSIVGFTYNTGDVKNNKYLNVDATIETTVNDPYFALAKARYENMSDSQRDSVEPILTVRHNGEIDKEKSLTYSDFNETFTGSGVWAATCTLSKEGVYVLQAQYKNLCGAPATTEAVELCIDKTAPAFGSVTISPNKPVVWDWIFASADTVLMIEADDLPGSTGIESSDIDPNAISVLVQGVSYPCTYDESKKTIICTFPADDRRILLKDIAVKASDKAGNETTISNLKKYGNNNIDDATSGIVVDASAPKIEVSYDNNDVCNGSYYAAPRTATVTITEASFDLVKTNDPRRVVVTKTLNGSTQNVYAEDFSNPSKDGVTWVASILCDSDGSYRIDAQFKDPSGKSAQAYQEEFTIDTARPIIMVTFDNNSAESGWYFKAPRTATIIVYENNFSPDLASVATTAAGGGAAPGISGWEQFEQGRWRTTVYFGEEMHYTMQVGCTDLAGNVAEEVAEPEFVIDMTAPMVSIERVENYTAYANQIAPRVSFSDTNFEPYLSEIVFTGAAQEQIYYMKNDETVTETSRVVEYDDFEYKLELDDVYTMHAKVKDKAGNEAEQVVVFSVNRFGSNYVLSPETKQLVGSYTQKSQDVVITETNVSGLTSSSVRLAKNDSARLLDSGKDYTLEENGSQTTWSSYTYTLPASLFEEDGYYRALLASHDVAGNYSENLMEGKNDTRDGALEVNFAIDGTSPVAALGNIDQNTAYFGPDQRVDFFASDNMEAEQAVLKVDGVQVAAWNAEDLASTRAFTYDLPASDKAQMVKAEVKDKAGNTTVTEIGKVTVTSNWFRYALNTPSILYPLIAGSILLVGALILIGGRVLQRRRQEAEIAS